MMVRRRLPSRRRGDDGLPGPERLDELVDAIVKGGLDRARYLEQNAESEEEAEMVRLIYVIRKYGRAGVRIPESRVDEIVAALCAAPASRPPSLRRRRRIEVLATGVGSGATLWYGLTQLDTLVFSVPGNRGSALLVAICGALVSLVLDGRAMARERVKSE